MTDLAKVAEQVARERKLRLPPDDVELDDLDFWIEVKAKAAAEDDDEDAD